MIETNDSTQLKPTEPQIAEEGDHGASWFESLTKQEKRFHILFYALAGLTGILIVQLIWQIAVMTAK